MIFVLILGVEQSTREASVRAMVKTMETTLVAINGVFTGLATVAVGIRLWSRKIQRCSLSLNDYAAMLGWVRNAARIVFPSAG